MTTAVNIHVNGRYRATVKQDDRQPVIVEGNYDGSPNPSGQQTFWLAHPAQSTFVITEEFVPADEKPAVVEEAPAAAEAPIVEEAPVVEEAPAAAAEAPIVEPPFIERPKPMFAEQPKLPSDEADQTA